LHLSAQALGEMEQDHLLLTREGDDIEVAMAEEPEPHACRYMNLSIKSIAVRA